MSIAKHPSKITLPQNNNYSTIFEFLVERFPRISPEIWFSRINSGKVHWSTGEHITPESKYQEGKIVYYYREVEQEPFVPYQHQIIYQDEHIIVADKPHFLPVTPGGQYIHQCLVEKLRKEFNSPNIVPLHRIDKDTAGLVMFSRCIETRGLYSKLFSSRQIQKLYLATANIDHNLRQHQTIQIGQSWNVESHISKSNPSFLMHETEGAPNAFSKIELINQKNNLGLFKLNPITGKTHQLRIHMLNIGFPILNDPFYPELKPLSEKNYQRPMQLIAKELFFSDPISKKQLLFQSNGALISW